MYFLQVFYLNFELYIALCCVLMLKEMSVNLTNNVLAENYQKLLHFPTFFFFLSVSLTTHSQYFPPELPLRCISITSQITIYSVVEITFLNEVLKKCS